MVFISSRPRLPSRQNLCDSNFTRLWTLIFTNVNSFIDQLPKNWTGHLKGPLYSTVLVDKFSLRRNIFRPYKGSIVTLLVVLVVLGPKLFRIVIGKRSTLSGLYETLSSPSDQTPCVNRVDTDKNLLYVCRKIYLYLQKRVSRKWSLLTVELSPDSKEDSPYDSNSPRVMD